MSNYESTLGKAIDILLNGTRLPVTLVRKLIEDGMSTLEVLALEARHLGATIN